MGTRSSFRIISAEKTKRGKLKFTTLVSIYNQYDGYPDGIPLDLVKFLNEGELTNGLPVGSDKKFFNGVGCLAAQVIHFQKKGEAGGCYIQKPKNSGYSGENYLYNIVVDEEAKTIMIVAMENDDMETVFFTGTPQEFINQYSKKEDDQA